MSSDVPAAPEQVSFEIELTPTEARVFYRHLASVSPRFRRIQVVGTVALFCVPAALVATTVLVPLWAVPLVVFVVAVNTTYLTMSERWTFASPRMVGHAEVHADAQGLTVRLGDLEQSARWTALSSWSEPKGCLMLVFSEDVGWAFPINRFPSPAHVEQLRAFLGPQEPQQ